MNASALDINLLTVSYEKTPVLWDVSLKVPQGELVGIIGPNGAGKSTLIKTALGLVRPIAGTISFFDQPLSKIKHKIAYIPQKESVDWEFPITVRELVLMGRYKFLKRLKTADYEAVDHYLNIVGLTAFKNRQISQLSGGQQQRAFLARALVQEADIYFLDEPFAGIDAGTEQVMIHLLKKLASEKKTVFVVHHDLNTVPELFSWTILLNLRLIASGTTPQTFTQENLKQAYGKNYALLDTAVKRAKEKESGTL